MFKWKMTSRSVMLLGYFVSRSDGALRLAEPRGKTLKGVDTIADDLQCAKKRNGEDQSGGTPDPGPEEQRQADCERVQAETRSNYLGINPVHRDDVHAHDGDEDGEKSSFVQRPEAARKWRDESEEYA